MATIGVESWTLSCRRCGAEFTVPVHRGRPPGYCDTCRRDRGWTPLHVVVDRLGQNRNRGPRTALDTEELVELQRRKREGWRDEHLATAYGISTRTVTRYLAITSIVELRVGPFRALFGVRSRGRRRDPTRPIQLSAWEKVT